MKAFFKELFDYSHHFNQQLADAIFANPDKTSEKAIQLYNHILDAHQIWNNRIAPSQTPFGVWEIHPVQHCKGIDKTNHETSLLIIDRFDLNETVSYSNTKGQPFTNNVRDILFHIINHSTYHRGQIATQFRENGLVPLITDYIYYKR